MEAKRRRIIIGSGLSRKVQGAPEPERHLFTKQQQLIICKHTFKVMVSLLSSWSVFQNLYQSSSRLSSVSQLQNSTNYVIAVFGLRESE